MENLNVCLTAGLGVFWNVSLISFSLLTYSKDVRLPQQLQRAMAAEAEASREARAKVTYLFV